MLTCDVRCVNSIFVKPVDFSMTFFILIMFAIEGIAFAYSFDEAECLSTTFIGTIWISFSRAFVYISNLYKDFATMRYAH